MEPLDINSKIKALPPKPKRKFEENMKILEERPLLVKVITNGTYFTVPECVSGRVVMNKT
jgi:hypothetical protein